MPGQDSIVSGVAGRYAFALYELAREGNAVDAVLGSLQDFEGLVDESPDLARLVRSPAFTSEEQEKAVSAILTRMGMTGPAANFIRLAAQNRRLFALPGMIRAYRQLVADARGQATAEVTAAQPLTDDQVSELKQSLHASTGKDVTLQVKVDPTLIGGLTVKIGSRLIDASLRTKLQSIKIAMKDVG